MTVNLGYACINETLQAQKITCNRGMIKRTFKAKGVPYASELALSNVHALKKIIEWNGTHGIKVYRMTSCLFPWFSEYDIFTMPDIDAIAASSVRLARDSKLAKTDWLVTKSVDTGVSIGSSWTTYRQELRDLPNSSGFPHSVTWPTEPSS